MKVHYSCMPVLACLYLLLCLCPQTAYPAAYGLLVGVSGYPNLPKHRWLHGPVNDVQLMTKVLQERGFAKENITILADGIKGAQLPTRKAILEQLKSLGNKVKKGDFVYLQLSGHGSQQPRLKGGNNREADGLDEIFLPYDIGKWESETGVVKNSISDDEIGKAVLAIRLKGAFVWAVFDSCHSGTMLRGAPAGDIVYRKIEPTELGIPATIHSAPPPSISAPVTTGRDDSNLGGYVAFYAAQPHELTPEMYLPRGKKDTKPYGLFSYAIARILSSNQPMSYRQAAQRILQSYTADNIRMPTPLFEGSHLDAPLFGAENSSPVRQWPIEQKGVRYRIKAGNLQQVEDGSLFAILASPTDKDEDALGYAIIKNTTLDSGELEAVQQGNLPKIDLADISRDAYARLITPEINLKISVALPQSANDAKQEKIKSFLEKLRALPQPKGITVNWVDAGEQADIRLGFSPNVPGCPRDRLWFLPSGGELICSGRHAALSLVLDKDEDSLQQALYSTLRSMGKVVNLLRLAEAVAAGRAESPLELSFYLRKNGQEQEKKIGPEQYPELQDGDNVRVEAHNRGKNPVDLTLLFVDSQYGISAEYPARIGELNRIQPGASIPDVIDATINSETMGTERLIAIAVTAVPRSPNADFSFLAQETLPRTRGEENHNCTDEQCSLEDWFKEAGFGSEGVSRGMRRNGTKRQKTSITMFSWKVGK